MKKSNLFLCLLCLAAASPVLAEKLAPKLAPVSEVLVEDEAGVIRLIVHGKTVVTIDKSGVTIAGDVRYTGVTQDVSPSKVNSNPQE
jgi:ethanolamine transporter EutH